MLVAGALALILAKSLGWQIIFLGLAGIMLVQPLATWWAPEAEHGNRPQVPSTLRQAVYGPWLDFLQRERAMALLCLIVAYKLSDAFQLSLSTAFLLRGPGFSLEEVGLVNKGVALIASLLGVTAGGFGLTRLGLVRALLIFGALQCSTSFGFLALALRGHDLPLMVAAVTFENFASGMGTAAFAALLMGLCSARYSATQFALLSALASIGRVYVGPTSGMLVENFGWARFFLIAAFTGVPGLWLVWWLRERIGQLDSSP
jgi:PAT family beta-lactamase induction signal transducer AmpG